MNRVCYHPLAALLFVWACAHPRTPQQDEMVRRGDCKELLRAADAARASDHPSIARDLAEACAPDKLAALVAASEPADGLLWCGRARATGLQTACDAATVAQLASQLHPRVTLGPPEPGGQPDPSLAAALAELGPAYNLGWNAEEPDVMVGKLAIAVDHATSSTTAVVPDANGNKQRIPATQHRFVARVQAEVELSGKTRVLRATEEARDLTWPAAPKLAVAAKFDPQVPPEAEL